MKSLNALVLVSLLGVSPAFAGVASTHCSDSSATIRVQERAMGHFEAREVTIGGESLQSLGLTESLGESTELESHHSNPPGHMSRVYTVKASYLDGEGKVVRSSHLICTFHYGF